MSAIPAISSTPPAAIGGRAASIERRRALSAGKSALPQPAERVRNGERSAALPATQVARPVAAAVAPAAAATPDAAAARTLSLPVVDPTPGSCRAQARARRQMLAQRGRGDAPTAVPSRPPREGRLEYAPKVVESVTHGRQSVTGLRIGSGRQVTGSDAGAGLPVSGTQYIGADAGAAFRGVVPKVGLARTARGGIVSGTLVRSRVAITGDEAGGSVTVTGEAEQRPEDDLTERSGDGSFTSAQFQRQVDPHGHSVFGTNLGRSAGRVGSRERRREASIESTEAGLTITGSALGRASRVTGDENGGCRIVTGDQYLTPAHAQAECAGTGGGTAPAAQTGRGRRDPVTGAKVGIALTWGRQRVTGPDVEHDPRVTGDAPGSCQVITGTPYQGPRTLHGWCDPSAGDAAEQRLPRRSGSAAVTGDTPGQDGAVTGSSRGAQRPITGTPYGGQAAAAPAAAAPAAADDVIAAIDAGFSVRSPQRTAHRRADRAAVDLPGAAGRVTGSFAAGDRKLTGNLEFEYRPRPAPERDAPPAHARISGEGRSAGRRISGDSWVDRKNVTGTDGFTAMERNPSERAGKPQAFSGAARFKALAVKEEHKQLVTGMFGWSSKTAAKVTLSGGAQG